MAGFHGSRDGVDLHCCQSIQSISGVTRFFGRDLQGVKASRRQGVWASGRRALLQ